MIMKLTFMTGRIIIPPSHNKNDTTEINEDENEYLYVASLHIISYPI